MQYNHTGIGGEVVCLLKGSGRYSLCEQNLVFYGHINFSLKTDN